MYWKKYHCFSFPCIIKSQMFLVKSYMSFPNVTHTHTHTHTHTYTHTHTESTSSRKRLTSNCTHNSKYTSLWTCVSSPHNMSCSQTPSFFAEFSGSCPTIYNFIGSSSLSSTKQVSRASCACVIGLITNIEFSLSLSLGLHVGYVGGEERPLTPLSE
jgi:hypothetical protein